LEVEATSIKEAIGEMMQRGLFHVIFKSYSKIGKIEYPSLVQPLVPSSN
jgi:hypothetical protein